MKGATFFALLATFILTVVAEDLLFVDTLLGLEQNTAQSIGFTTKIVTEAQWRSMTTAEFLPFKAIIIADEFGSSDITKIQFLADTKDVWGPAVQGNIIIHGADQSNHGKTVLIENSIRFAASGQTLQGNSQTGLYISLSQYYDQIAVSQVPALSYFGSFEVRGQLSCYDKVHIVASSPAITTLTDADLSNWSCSVHEAFSAYPTSGVNGFQAIAIADGIVAPGTQTYADSHSGLPYILTRGATPAGCGDGKWEPVFGEECDDGNTVDGDGCSKSCKCESGLPKGDGTCYPRNSNSSSSFSVPSFSFSANSFDSRSHVSFVNPTSIASSGSPSEVSFAKLSILSTRFSPSSTIDYVQNLALSITLFQSSKSHHRTTLLSMPSYPIIAPSRPHVTQHNSKPTLPPRSCIGVEIIVSVIFTEVYSTVAPGTTVTLTTTSVCSTYQKPIYDAPDSSMPCYVCAFSAQGISKGTDFITATTTHCAGCSIAIPATVYPCATCPGTTLTATCPWQTTPPFESQGAMPYTSYAPHVAHKVHPTMEVNPVSKIHQSVQTSHGIYHHVLVDEPNHDVKKASAVDTVCTICSRDTTTASRRLATVHKTPSVTATPVHVVHFKSAPLTTPTSEALRQTSATSVSTVGVRLNYTPKVVLEGSAKGHRKMMTDAMSTSLGIGMLSGLILYML